MKKLLGVALLGVLAIGCGGGSKETKPTPPAADPAAAPAPAPAEAPPPGAPPAQ